MRAAFVAIIVVFVAGCAQVFSERANTLVDPTVSFAQLKKDPEIFKGKYVKLGGIIASTKNTNEGSQLEIVQFKLGSDDVPDESMGTGGRFLATTPEYLDTMVYKTGRPVALVGEIKGLKILPLDELEYRYPVIAIAEIHVWKRSDPYPYPPPYYQGPFFYPYWWYGPPYWYPY